ncbi:ATP-binding protein [Fodinicurvata halophila]|uniref:ATP-binding protein n=1 Tax=Fodinicurvata halophila TaxID=1419723 RepID=A0ABV8ULR3_9PROT
MYERFLKSRLRTALSDTPVVLVEGPRRAGKTTLVRSLEDRTRSYVTLDDQTALAAARDDPVGFVRGLDHVVIDEVQRVPEVLLAIKKSIDEDYRPGRFLLTGSANILTLPRVADSLAGRMETLRLLPLAQAELHGQQGSFLTALYEGRFSAPDTRVLGDDLIRLVLAGSFAEALQRSSERRRQDWMRAYLNSVLNRDLRDIAEIEKLTELPRFVRVLARQSAQLVNFSQLGNSIGINYKTAQRYLGLLEQLFLVSTQAPWYRNRLKRVIKTPKLHVMDSGLLGMLCGLTLERLRRERNLLGPLLESFVFAEITKLATWAEEVFELHHFRDHVGHEVDLVLERGDGRITGLEVKASATVTPADFAGLRQLSELTGEAFTFGAVLYDGDTVVSFGDRLAAVPLSCLWE